MDKVLPESAILAGFQIEQPDEVIRDGKPVTLPRVFYRGESANFGPTESSLDRDDFSPNIAPRA